MAPLSGSCGQTVAPRREKIMRPLKVRFLYLGMVTRGEGIWVDCSSDRAIIVQGAVVYHVPFDSLEVLEDATGDGNGSDDYGRSSGSRDPVAVGSATSI